MRLLRFARHDGMQEVLSTFFTTDIQPNYKPEQ